MSPLRHWYETNPAPQPAPAPAPEPKLWHKTYHHGPKAKPIVYNGVTYKTWAEACAATGKTSDAIRWAIKLAARSGGTTERKP